MLRWCLLLLIGLLSQVAAMAQSGPYGNEWIVPNQQYYKIKIAQDGLYRLDYNYLTQAGISGVNPQRFQLWRRGKEVAIYVGPNNPTTLTPATYIEFYGLHNDGQLDVGMYKRPQDHSQKLYSLYTDTASYFLTWSATTNGKRMAAPSLAPAGGNHPYWIKNDLYERSDVYAQVNEERLIYQPWAEAGEGFYSVANGIKSGKPDSLTLNIPFLDQAVTSGPLPLVEILFVGASERAHNLVINYKSPTTGAFQPLIAPFTIQDFEGRKVRYTVPRNVVYSDGVARQKVAVDNSATNSPVNLFRIAYTRVQYPVVPAWPTGGREVAFRNDSTLGSAPAFYQLNNIPASVRGLDVTDPYNVQRIEGVTTTGTQRAYVFPSALPGTATRNLLLTDVEQALVPPLPARRVRFRTISPAAHNFLIVTHRQLMKPTTGSQNPVRDYATYRAARFDTLVVTSDQLYDQFHYGEKSALAIRQFSQYMLTNARAKYLLLLGQGVQPSEALGSVYIRKQPELYRLTGTSPVVRDLVPTSTRGASDIFFTADWMRDDYAGRMGTGRLAASTPEEVLAYLEKLKQHEQGLDASLESQAWRKNAINLLGAQHDYEYSDYLRNLNAYKALIEKPLFGGKVTNTYTHIGLPTIKNVSADLNAGVSLITYYGHGDPDILQLDLGDINDPSLGYNNVGKYPMMFVNGCAAGNAYRANRAKYAQDWVLASQKGLIGLMAESSLGFAGDVDTQQRVVYAALLNDPVWYGRPVADVQNEAIRRLQRTTTSPSAISSWMSTVWHADPAVRLYSPPQPDFTFGAPALEIRSVDNNPVRAKSPTFNLLVRVKNTGKITTQKLDILVERKYDNGSPTTTDEFRNLNQPEGLGDTTYVLPIRNLPGAKVFGNNTFTVTLDDQNKVAELSETNNQAKYDFVFLEEGITLLNPPEFALVAPANVRLVGQTNDPVGAVRGFELELDTVPTFNSALIMRTKINAALLADWRPKLPALAGRDSVVWYWRMRFETPVNGETKEWSTSSFRVVRGTTGGWSQSHHGQFVRDELTGLSVAAPSGKWSFDAVTQTVSLQTKGGGDGSAVTYQPGYGIQLGSEPVTNVECGVNVPNILVAVYDGTTLRPLRTIGGGPYDSCGQAPNPYYHFASQDPADNDNINTPARQAQLLSLLTNIPQGAYVALVSVNKVNFSSFSPALKAAFTALGAQRINSLQDSDPYALFSHKVAGQPVAQEATANTSSTVPRNSQVITLSGALNTFGTSGTLTSVRIGPAQEWTTLHHTIRVEPSDSYKLQLVGIDAQGNSKVLDDNITLAKREYPLAGISAATYPYLQLVLTATDNVNHTAPQIKQLLVSYRGYPEGVVRRDSVVAKSPKAYDAAALAVQANNGYIEVPVIFQNVSALPFGTPLKATFTLRNATKEVSTEIDLTPLNANGAVNFNARLNLGGQNLYGDLSGSITLNINKEGRRLPELYYFNNELTLPTFRVEDRSVPPVLDVAFDGQRILNGDIVSPRPVISVMLTDEDLLQPITDRNAFDLILTPRNGPPKKVDLTASNVTFTTDPAKGTARIDFEPGQATPLPDGQYTLEAQGRDATGRTAGTENYKVQFEVINASTITNIFPYPNPITHKAKFVFTLTGAELPRNMKIQIMTLTGKVVREIMMQELGMLRIGNNITDYAWDGTDEYGDRLANGTYLYRVVLDDPQSKFDRRNTVADKAFKNGWGKLVLLR
ncbi:peptidase C25-like protein [Hymenobacter chitinivorans DSM 11115]|uniref:Peptidase C25-like protein n=1 Tax=Hymenobacter chitinivorans DSM 11115 TaxID=1121954 RepID=A0A2M9BT55_9BACT|nr:peptidase C25-like protein [Hymenobacter chitinivorans DSM 11115]